MDHSVDLASISDLLQEPSTVVWFDVVDPSPDDLGVIQEEFDLHPLAVEDAVTAHERPKIEAYNDYWFVVIQAASLNPSGIDIHEIALFVGKQFLVSVRHQPVFPTDEIQRRWQAHSCDHRESAGFLLYTFLDVVVDGYLPVAEAFQDRVDDLEALLFRSQQEDPAVLPRIFEMKKDAQRFRRATLPMRDILNPLIRRDLDLFPEDETPYFRDVYDHAILVIDQLDSARDLVNSALEIHLSMVANRQNEVSKQLTVIATIFLPLSFVVGFFGQNFGWMVTRIGSGETFVFLGLGSELLAVFAMFVFFKRRGWF